MEAETRGEKMALIGGCVPRRLPARVSDTCFNAYRSTRLVASGSRSPQSVFQSPSRSALRRFYGHCGARPPGSRRRPVVGKPAARTTEVREEDGRSRKGKRGLISRGGKV